MALDLVNKLPYDHPYRWDGTAVGGVKLWRPDELGASLALWLDAADASTVTLNGSNVSQWDDKSGNGRNAAQSVAANQPAYLTTGFNGKPTLQTNGADFLEFGVTSLGRNVSGLTCAIVGVHPAGQTFINNTNEIFISAAGNTGFTRFATTPNPSASTGNRYAIAGRRLDTDSYATASSSTDSLANRGNPWIRVAQRAYSDGVANHWTDGTQDMTNETMGTQGAGNTNDTDSLRGELFKGVALLPNGSQLSEIVLTHSTMTTDDRQKLEGYLAHKWGLTDNLPVEHPYKLTPPYAGKPVYDPDAQTYFNRVEGPTGDNQTLEASVKTAINDFVVGCKSDGIWDAIKSSAILAGARTLNGALQPLAGTAPTNYNFVSGDYNRKTGLVGDGSTKYLDTNRAGNNDPRDNNHLAVYGTSFPSTFSYYAGLLNHHFGWNANAIFSRNNATGTGSGVALSSANLVGITRSSSTSFVTRAAGSSSSVAVTSQVPDARTATIFASNNTAGPVGFSSARLAFYSIGESIDLAALDTRVSALMTALDGAIA